MENKINLPYTDSYWVVPGKLLAGVYPGSHNEELTKKSIQALFRSGITSFIDLTQPQDVHLPYHQILNKEALDHGLTVCRLNFPIPDFTAPPLFVMKSILDTIDQMLEMNMVVYVHCLAGIGRTGTVVGCYLVRHGFTGEAAIEQISYLRRDLPNWWHRSPEVDDQMEYILNWIPGT